MDNYRLINVDRQEDVACIRLKKTRLDETEIILLGDEILHAASQSLRPRVALSLGGQQAPECMYSIFLAKLISLRNAMRRQEGDFVLVEVGPVAYAVFEACHLHKEFAFLPDFAAAVRYFQATA
jgi:hypothetical protein